MNIASVFIPIAEFDKSFMQLLYVVALVRCVVLKLL